jgi:hypothetical protein
VKARGVDFDRRSFLGLGVAALVTLPQRVSAGAITVPTIGSLDLTVVVDNLATSLHPMSTDRASP